MITKFIIILINFVSFNLLGQIEMAITYSPGSNNNNLECHDLTVDSSGNIYTCGKFYSEVDFDPGPQFVYASSINNYNCYIRKLDPQGNFLWVKTYGGSDDDDAKEIIIDNNSDLIITGLFEGTADFDPGGGSEIHFSTGISSLYVLKINTNGDFIWAKSFEGSSYVTSAHISTNLNNEYFIAGSVDGDIDLDPGPGTDFVSYPNFGGVFILKLDVNGQYVWGGSIAGTGWDEVNSIAADNEGNCVLAGHFEESIDLDPSSGYSTAFSQGLKDIFIIKLDNIGQLNWARTFGSKQHDAAYDIKIAANGDICVSGYFSDTINFNPFGTAQIFTTDGYHNTFVLKLKGNGDNIWARNFKGDLNESRKIIIDDENNIFVGGTFWSNVDFDPSEDVNIITTNGDNDIYLSCLDSNGNLIRVVSFPCTSQSYLWCMEGYKNGNLVLDGAFCDTIDLNPGPIEENYSSGHTSLKMLFTLILDTNMLKDVLLTDDELILFPNPTNNLIYFNNQNEIIEGVIHDNYGNVVLHFENLMEGQAIDIGSFNCGNYYIIVKDLIFKFTKI